MPPLAGRLLSARRYDESCCRNGSTGAGAAKSVLQLMTCIGVTGATGFLGSALCEIFANRGWTVIGLSRHPRTAGTALFRHFDLTEAADPAMLQDVDVLVHTAYDMEPGQHAVDANIEGTHALFAAAARAGVRQIVMISSMSAAKDSATAYGRNKYAAEQLLDPSRDLIVRPGLIVGDGGLFRSMYKTATRYHVAPLFSGGRQPVYVVGIEDLCKAIADLVERQAHGAYTVTNDEPVLMRDLYRAIAAKAGQPVFFIPLPLNPILALLSLAERLGLKLPLNSERLAGIRNLRIHRIPRESTLGVTPLPLRAVLDSLSIR